MNKIKLFEKLTLLYLESHDISNLSPEELYDKYDEVFKAIQDHHAKKRPPQKIG